VSEPLSDDELGRGGTSWPEARYRASIHALIIERNAAEAQVAKMREGLELWQDNVSDRDQWGKCWWCRSNRVSAGAEGSDGHYEPCPSHIATLPPSSSTPEAGT
jgi:hypothetical protein